jgi:hypothetical protein
MLLILSDRRGKTATASDRQVTVIPGRRAAASPESIFTNRGYGFRARAFGASRNDASPRHRPRRRAIQYAAASEKTRSISDYWIPACAGMTGALLLRAKSLMTATYPPSARRFIKVAHSV